MIQPLLQSQPLDIFPVLNIEQKIRKSYPGRNEKYYQILVLAQRKLISSAYKLELTADAIIKNCNSARPTWYAYFRSVEHYYSEILDVVGTTMLSNTLDSISKAHDFDELMAKIENLQMEVFLSNFKSLASCFPVLLPVWKAYYENMIDGYTAILQPMLKLSYGRARLFAKRMVNERILHTEKYAKNPASYYQYAKVELHLVTSEQNR